MDNSLLPRVCELLAMPRHLALRLPRRTSRAAFLFLFAACWLMAEGPASLALAQPPAADADRRKPEQPPAAKPKPPAPPGEVPAKPDGKAEPGQEKPGDAGEEKPEKKRAYEREHYDVIVLDKTNDNAELRVLSLPFRKLPDKPKRVGKLKVRLLESRDEDYEVMWRHIERIDFFEDFVLREADQVVAQAAELGAARKYADARRAFDEAYGYYLYLLRFAPDTPGLPASLHAYLYMNAGILFLAGRVPEAFSTLEELFRRNPKYQLPGGTQTVHAALERVGGQFLKGFVDRQDYAGARVVLERLERDYGEQLQIVAEWRERLAGVAAKKRDEAAAHLAAGRLREAHDTSREMLKIWPRVAGGRELVIEIARRYPLVVVGVAQPALQPNAESLDNPAARRAGQLVQHTLLRYAERGPEGGRYDSPVGTFQLSDDRKQLVFDVRTAASLSGLGAGDVARELLALADPAAKVYRPAWGSLLAGVQLTSPTQVVADLRRSHVLPQSWLQTRLTQTPQNQRYTVVSRTETEVRYEPVQSGAAPTEPRPVIVERYFPDPRKALDALRKGTVDMLDRVLPNDALRLQADPAFVVGRYDFPTVHVLVPNPKQPFLASRTFRRALLHAINRQVILERGLLNKKTVEGCRLLSAPLPAGVTTNDPAAYAYDDKLEVRPYDPVLAMILVRLAQHQLEAAADERKEPPPELKPLVLAHPATEDARFIAKQIQSQLELIELPCQLRELPPGATTDPEARYDLLYQELTLTEPLIDVVRVFGPGGVWPSADPYLSLALRRLDAADSWKEARARLYEVHRVLYEDVTMIPLWQMVDHFVYHRGLRGLTEHRMSLYQDVEQWRVVPVEEKP